MVDRSQVFNLRASEKERSEVALVSERFIIFITHLQFQFYFLKIRNIFICKHCIHFVYPPRRRVNVNFPFNAHNEPVHLYSLCSFAKREQISIHDFFEECFWLFEKN